MTSSEESTVTTETRVAAGRIRRARRAQNCPMEIPPVTRTSRNSKPEIR